MLEKDSPSAGLVVKEDTAVIVKQFILEGGDTPIFPYKHRKDVQRVLAGLVLINPQVFSGDTHQRSPSERRRFDLVGRVLDQMFAKEEGFPDPEVVEVLIEEGSRTGRKFHLPQLD